MIRINSNTVHAGITIQQRAHTIVRARVYCVCQEIHTLITTSFYVFAAVWMRNPFLWDVKLRQQQSGSDDPVMRLRIAQERNPRSNVDRRYSYVISLLHIKVK
jgi:hypothetical protein